MTSSDDLVHYYSDRAEEYERVYQKPERQRELAELRTLLPTYFAGRDVLEIACGTGYWTVEIAKAARSIVATDVNEAVLDVARRKQYPAGSVRFARADAYTMDDLPGRFSAAFLGFWFSHVPRQRRSEFLVTLHARLMPGAVVVMLDNRFVPGSNNPLSQRIDEFGNNYSLRQLEDGSRWEILKNFPTEDELTFALVGAAVNIEYRAMTYYWMLRYKLKG